MGIGNSVADPAKNTAVPLKIPQSVPQIILKYKESILKICKLARRKILHAVKYV